MHISYRDKMFAVQRALLFEGRKFCVSCGWIKPIDAYTINRRQPDGRSYLCNICDQARQEASQKEYRLQNAEKIRARAREYQRKKRAAQQNGEAPQNAVTPNRKRKKTPVWNINLLDIKPDGVIDAIGKSRQTHFLQLLNYHNPTQSEEEI